MAQYSLIDSTRYLQGLPSQLVLDDADLSEEQKSLLEQAIKLGIYAPAKESEPKKPKGKSDGKEIQPASVSEETGA